MSEILDWLIRYGYLAMFLAMLVEGPAVTASAALGAALGYFDVFVVFALSFFANFLPDVLYYALGAWGGQRALDKFGARVGIHGAHRERPWISSTAIWENGCGSSRPFPSSARRDWQ